MFFNWKPRFREDESETFYFEEFFWVMWFRPWKVYRFQTLVVPIKHTLNACLKSFLFNQKQHIAQVRVQVRDICALKLTGQFRDFKIRVVESFYNELLRWFLTF